jgi:hypothetical protein
MKVLAFALMVILLAAAPLAAAQKEHVLELNMTLGEDMEPVDPCVLSGQCAIGHVYVNITEPPPQPGITGFFAFEPLDIDLEAIFSGAISKIKGFLSDLLCSC